MELRPLLAAATLVLSLVLPAVGCGADLPMTAEEFGLWRDYQSAISDPRVQKMPEKQRLPAIAKNFRAAEKTLKEAVEKGEQYGEGIGAQVQALTRGALSSSDFAARIKEVRVDTSAAHVVAYVTWVATTHETIDREACQAASKVFKSNGLIKTLKIEVLDPDDEKKRLFEALIGRENAGRIDEERIVDFASTRYRRLFEKVKRADP
ncbi:MAG: hypothetical protein HY901_20565 [Deltaproteobacteria bacterium]|nr:hypothetical protein [Deltaproteobacteria bacterium]